MESVDILTLLKRARKTVAQNAAAASEAEAEGHHEFESNESKDEQSPKEPAKHHPPVPQIDEQAELEFIRTELYTDEVLIQRILGMLYRQKKENPFSGFISILDMERILGLEREGATFVMSYMKTHHVIEMDDKSRMSITVPGIDYLRKVFGIHASPTLDTVHQEPNSEASREAESAAS